MIVADFNWLLSAAAQSGAALVAIVGGLLGSRYITLDAEQQAARRRVDQLHQECLRLGRVVETRKRATINAWLSEREVDSDLIELFLRHRDLSTYQCWQLSKAHPPCGLEEEDVLQGFSTLKSAALDALQTLSSMVPPGIDHLAWPDFARTYGLEPPRQEIWHRVYEVLVGERIEREASAKTGIGAITARAARATRRPAIRSPQLASPQNPLKGACRDLQLSSHELDRADDSLRWARNHLNETRQPAGFRLSIQVLIVVAVLTIVVPVAGLVVGSTSAPLMVRILIALTFLAGVWLLLRFLHVYAQVLSADHLRNALPETVLGLLRRSRRTSRTNGRLGKRSDRRSPEVHDD